MFFFTFVYSACDSTIGTSDINSMLRSLLAQAAAGHESTSCKSCKVRITTMTMIQAHPSILHEKKKSSATATAAADAIEIEGVRAPSRRKSPEAASGVKGVILVWTASPVARVLDLLPVG